MDAETMCKVLWVEPVFPRTAEKPPERIRDDASCAQRRERAAPSTASDGSLFEETPAGS